MTTEVLSGSSVLEVLCKSGGKWGIYLSYGGNNDFTEVIKAAPILGKPENIQALVDGECYILTKTEEECNIIFDSVVGDDGPTKLNPYNGPARVYALTCSSDGQLRNENT